MKLFRSFAVSLLMAAGAVGIVAYAITQTIERVTEAVITPVESASERVLDVIENTTDSVSSAVDATFESVDEIVEVGRIFTATTKENADEVVDLVDESADVALAIGQETWTYFVDYGTREMDQLNEAGNEKATSIWRSTTELAEDRWEAGVDRTTVLAEDGRDIVEALWARSGS
jgi:CHASE3 domain sensor protein